MADHIHQALDPFRIAVIIPHYADLPGLAACLASLDRQTLPRDRFDIIVVDNDSPCGRMAVEAVVADRAMLLVSTERGAGPTRNAGIAASTCENLAFIDSDCVAAPGWLAAGLAALEGATIVGGRVEVSVRHPGQRSGAEAFEQVFAFDNETYVRKKHFSVTANLFSTRRVFAKIGGFRQIVSEDTDWCHRARAAGLGITYCGEATVSHPARTDWPELLRKWRRIQQERFALYCERPRGRLKWLASAVILPLSILPHAVTLLTTPRLDNFGERWRGLSTLVRIRLWRFGDALRLAATAAVQTRPAPPTRDCR